MELLHCKISFLNCWNSCSNYLVTALRGPDVIYCWVGPYVPLSACCFIFYHCMPMSYLRPLLFLEVVSEMTYTVSSGTLNSSIPYHTIFRNLRLFCLCIFLCVKGLFLKQRHWSSDWLIDWLYETRDRVVGGLGRCVATQCSWYVSLYNYIALNSYPERWCERRACLAACGDRETPSVDCIDANRTCQFSHRSAARVWPRWTACSLVCRFIYGIRQCEIFLHARWHTTKCGAGRIWTVTICRSLWPICGSVITVGLGLGLGLGLGSGSGLELRLWLGLGLGSGLQIVVYKLLEKATKCGSITWLKLTNGDAPRRSAPLRILSCP